MSEYTLDELATCAEREVKQRLRVYPRLTMKGTMTEAQALRETAMMRAIADRLRAECLANPATSGRLL